MVKPRLSYSNVTATIALLLAISGGAYAMGDSPTTPTSTVGTVPVISRTVDVPTGNSTPVTILKVAKFGVLLMAGGSSCSQAPGQVTAFLVWKNTTTTSQRVSFEREGSTTSTDVAPGVTGTVNQLVRFANKDIFQGELRVSGYKGKQAVMDVSVAIGGAAGQHCRVTVNSIVAG